MKRRLLYLFLPIITLVLEILPYGAVCNFANPDGASFRKTFSYFDLTPFGYANFSPFLTALITSVVFALLLIYLLSGKRQLMTAARTLLCVGFGLSLCPLLYGVDFFSVVGVLISLSLALELVLILVYTKRERE